MSAPHLDTWTPPPTSPKVVSVGPILGLDHETKQAHHSILVPIDYAVIKG